MVPPRALGRPSPGRRSRGDGNDTAALGAPGQPRPSAGRGWPRGRGRAIVCAGGAGLVTRTQGLVISYTRCNDPGRAQDWSNWYDEVHLPDLVGRGGVWAATRWQLTEPPVPGRPSLGFSHVAIYELEGA